MPTGVSILFASVSIFVGVTVFRFTGRSYTDQKGLFLRCLCSVLFLACIVEFMLILSEVLQAGDHEVRAYLWKFVTGLLLILIVVIIPAVQIARYFVVKHPKLKFMVLPVFLGYLLLFRIASTQLPIERYVPHKVDSSASSTQGKLWFDLRQDSLACISFIGITTMAFLCGISSISAPYTAFFGDRNEVSEVDSDRLRRSLQSIEEMIIAKEMDVNRIRLEISRNNSSEDVSRTTSASSSGTSTPRTGSTFSLTRLMSGFVKMGDNRQAKLKSLLVEYNALVSLHNEVDADLNNVNQKLKQQQYHKTLKGKLHRVIFAIFACYCIYRVFNTYIRMCWWLFSDQPHDNPKGGPRDALVLLIATTIDNMVPDIAIGTLGWSRIIGVIMSGAVFIAALNGVLQMSLRMMRMLHKAPKSIISPDTRVNVTPTSLRIALDPLLVGQVMGVYILSIVTTLRFNLPSSMSGPIIAALVAPLKVTSVQLWNDIVLGVTSTATLLVIIAMNRLGSDTIYDEEKGDIC